MNERRSNVATRSARSTLPPRDQLKPTSDLTEYCREYARERPEVVALWCFGIGFVLGWKLKLW